MLWLLVAKEDSFQAKVCINAKTTPITLRCTEKRACDAEGASTALDSA